MPGDKHTNESLWHIHSGFDEPMGGSLDPRGEQQVSQPMEEDIPGYKEREEAQIREWRLNEFQRLGFSPETAMELAMGKLDLNEFRRLIEKGASPEQAQQIVAKQAKWHISMGGLCPHCSKPMVGNDCPGCGYAEKMQATDMNYKSPGTGLSPNPDMLPPGNPVSAKWHYALRQDTFPETMQQPSGVGTPPPNPEDDPNYLAMDDVAPMSFDEEVAYQKWVDYAVDQLNQGKQPQEILADLQHSGCDDPMAVLERAIQQPLNTDGNLQNVPQEQPPLGENQDAMVNNSTSSGAGDTVSQPPAFQAKVKGTEIIGKVEAQWVDLYGQEVSRIRTAAGVQDILTENVEPVNQMETDPVNIINELINSVEPPDEKTKASVHAHIEHLKDASRLCRQALYSNITDEQMERIAKIEASTQVAILNLTDELRKLQPSLDDYLASQPTYRHDGYGLEEMLTTETTAHVNTSAYDRLMDEHPKLVVHDLSPEERLDASTVRRAASDYISQYIWELPPKLRTSMAEEFTEATLAEARKAKPEPQQKTASVEEPIENFDGPASALFI